MTFLRSKLSILLFLLCSSIVSILANGQNNCTCLQTNNENGLPVFRGYGDGSGQAGARIYSRRILIHHQHQVIISSYKFNCCGSITEWSGASCAANPSNEMSPNFFSIRSVRISDSASWNCPSYYNMIIIVVIAWMS